MNTTRKHSVLPTVLFILAAISGVGSRNTFANEPPVAEAGPSRYAAQEPLQLDGTKSYDPDRSGPLTYAWTQVSGPPLVILGATTAIPFVGGFVQTQQMQECQFQLLVHDAQQASAPDAVKVVIVPDSGPRTLKLENPPFDVNKPTVIYFWGAQDCISGETGHPWGGGPAWTNRANIIDFPYGYAPDSGTAKRTYYMYGDMIIAYLSAVAPDYRQAIQTIGFSTGVDIALDVGIRLNEAYRDARYAVNRVTEIDGGCRIAEGGSSYPLPEAANRLSQGNLEGWNKMEGWRMYLENVERFLASSVDGEQCWIDFYYGPRSYVGEPMPPSDILWVRSGLDHPRVNDWYRNSLTASDMNRFNGGVVGGAYWSVVGPGKNLQLASEPGVYYFHWNGSEQNGAMDFFNQPEYPGKLPEPVTLLDLHDPQLPEDDPNGMILTCQESKNAVGYQLLSGSDPYNVVSYHIVMDNNSPPAVPVTKLPPSDTWWTVKARDAYGSTIYADPVRVGTPAGVTAYWKLDEVEGNRAEDSAGSKDGIVHGGARWQPAGGQKAGALAFDGIDDHVSTGSVLDPSAGPFSVFAWVKGGSPGQVILSQAGGADWLRAAPTTGVLRTELNEPGRNTAKHLSSAVVITDGAWHRVGLVWDGTDRALYVDDMEVARGTLTELPDVNSGLYLGAGSKLAPGTNWSGLIDDVRVYNQAVRP